VIALNKRVAHRKTVAAGALVAAATTVAVVLAVGILAGIPEEVPAVFAAACKYANAYCIAGYRTAAVDVRHGVEGGASITPVEPDDGETWSITAFWNTAPPLPCFENQEAASATVSWTGSTWQLSNVTLTANITDIDVCDFQTCDAVDVHSHGYRLVAKVVDPHLPGGIHNLRQVVFATTSVDDGYELDTSTCTLGTSVSPTSQTFSATDSGGFECGYSCDNSGTNLLITYE
jgi:hypothetical protein